MSKSFLGILAVFLFAAAPALAVPGEPADQPPGFVNLKDGDTVTSPGAVKVTQATGLAVTPGSHTHLIIDSPLPKPGVMMPMDARHIHLMAGVTEKTLDLAPGDHTLQLVLGGANHQIRQPLLASPLITIHVQPKP